MIKSLQKMTWRERYRFYRHFHPPFIAALCATRAEVIIFVPSIIGAFIWGIVEWLG